MQYCCTPITVDCKAKCFITAILTFKTFAGHVGQYATGDHIALIAHVILIAVQDTRRLVVPVVVSLHIVGGLHIAYTTVSVHQIIIWLQILLLIVPIEVIQILKLNVHCVYICTITKQRNSNYITLLDCMMMKNFSFTFNADLCIMCVSKFNELLIVKFTLTNHWWVRYSNYHCCDGLSHHHYVFLSAFTQV